MPAGYAPLPNPRSAPEAERELEAAFDSDHDESSPLASPHSRAHVAAEVGTPLTVSIPGAYDFERDYDHPPPGSPPGPSAQAQPNNFGNTNGCLPTSPVRPVERGPSFFRRAVGALLPQHYARIPTEPTVSRPRGGGTENDGVFANVMAKPGRAVPVRNENGEVHMVPEESQKDAPPSYLEAQADAVPPYWETTVHAPIIDTGADMIVGDLPTGTAFLFAATLVVSYFFQFVGFLLTYLLHTTHAGKYGSRAGLGLTLIHYGFYSRSQDTMEEAPLEGSPIANGTKGLPVDWELSSNGTYVGYSPADPNFTSRDWISLLLMTLGNSWFLFLSSIVGFYRVKRWEMSIAASATSASRPPDQQTADEEEERWHNLREIFGVERDLGELGPEHRGPNQTEEVEEGPLHEAEVRLVRDLRSAGLL
ncbi:hypothetical protein OBBRIDRAFT_722814 [Obba rivulosa]|uniref:Metal homeostatis protein bsd2 n=1 Tax=Obba rivulosa TaxID=1052685 RepID=A0A8E2DRM1_9APHY|nr:hypothetical protein OBBRIDRAFT_722814 [Obba rivulosa]